MTATHHNGTPRAGGKPLPETMRRAIRIRIERGNYSVDIQRECNVSSPTVNAIAKRYGLKLAVMPHHERARRVTEAAKRAAVKTTFTDAQREWRGKAYSLRWHARANSPWG
jgi:phosphoribosylformylglycinamidine (FGAM) synthase-like amidotransferase family enzyme